MGRRGNGEKTKEKRDGKKMRWSGTAVKRRKDLKGAWRGGKNMYVDDGWMDEDSERCGGSSDESRIDLYMVSKDLILG